MKKKNLLMLPLAAAVLCALPSCQSNKTISVSRKKIAMITDYGDITDESFNQNTYEGIQAFQKKHASEGVVEKYYKPASDSDADRIAKIEQAIGEGYGTIVMPGYAFGKAISTVSKEYPGVRFFALDVGKSDFAEGYDIDAYENAYTVTYKEEYAGFLAGYAACVEGYRNLGFLGGMAVPAVKRYGYGFVRGVDYYKSTHTEDDTQIQIKYAYGNQFFGDATIKARMDTWYAGDSKEGWNATDVIFCCGGGIYKSALEAAVSVRQGTSGKTPKIIGVDVDQRAAIMKDTEYAKYPDIILTSATKGLSETVQSVLEQYVINHTWKGSTVDTLSFAETFDTSSTDDSSNFVKLPKASFDKKDQLIKFTYEDYLTLVKNMYTCHVSEEIEATLKDLKTAITIVETDLGKEVEAIEYKNKDNTKGSGKGFVIKNEGNIK